MNTATSVAEIADILCPLSAPAQVLAMLRAYYDDSGTHRGSPIVSVAGLVGDGAEWRSLEALWTNTLGKYELDDFHATECEAREGKYANLKRLEADSLIRELAKIISDADVEVVSASVRSEIWDRYVIANSEAAPFLERYPNPLAFCFEHCIQVTANWSRNYKEGSPVALVFNSQGSDEAYLNHVFSYYQKSQMFGEQLNTLGFVPRRKFPPLQAVDLVAYGLYRDLNERVFGPGGPIRPALDIISSWRTLPFAKVWNRFALSKAIETYLGNLITH